MLFLIGWILSVTGISVVFVVHPAVVGVLALLRRRKRGDAPGTARQYKASLIIVAHNAEGLVAGKLRNSLDVAPASEGFEILFFSDGSSDGTVREARQFEEKGVRVISAPAHEGKFAGMNRAAMGATGDILIFSDVDALLATGSIPALLAHFSDDNVGGVCGLRVVSEHEQSLAEAQHQYVSLDTAVKEMESRCGSISSNDGKLYAIRRELFVPVPAGVTDDLFEAMNVVRQRRRFVFERSAVAAVPLPSRDPRHELERRRRIVSASWRGISRMRTLLNPLRYGYYSFSLFANKIMRRLLPFFLIGVFASSGALSLHSLFFAVVFVLQLVFYALAMCHVTGGRLAIPGIMRRLGSMVFYFCLGNVGMLLGVWDFLRGREPVKWTPRKSD